MEQSRWHPVIGNQPVPVATFETIINPWNGSAVGEVGIASETELELALNSASESRRSLFALPRYKKAAICENIARGIAAHQDDLAALITAESGKPLQYARGEVARAISTFTIAAAEALRFSGEIVPLDISGKGEGLTGYFDRVPLGPVAAISPFNFPLNLVAHKVAPAIAVGTPVILKPAVQTPLSAIRLAQIAAEAGLPEGALAVLPMANETAEKLVRDHRPGVFSFTGSDKVGWHLKSLAGKKRVLLELGGNAPAIIHDDADINDAAKKLAIAGFAAAGQVCIKAQRLIVHHSIYDGFMDAFLHEVGQLPVGDPTDPATVVGPLIDEKSAQRVESWVGEAAQTGSVIRYGGSRNGALMQPTILENVPSDAKCVREEIFGPVCVVAPYSHLDEAISMANNTRYGLQAAIFSNDVRTIDKAVDALEYGGVIINDSPMLRLDNYPYGGAKDSGLGREGVRYSMEEYTQPKMVIRRQVR